MVHERHGVVCSQHAAGAVCLDVREELLRRRRTSETASAIAPGVALDPFGSYGKRAAHSESHNWLAMATLTYGAVGADECCPQPAFTVDSAELIKRRSRVPMTEK
ncbi:hypothetical protein VFPFJ_07559 [Purpureocillium lilacinum]|uniref:Uncharacterized protein n=1 Tax=Purpureocillium lilacinum TaxID=33203 RepID=A0A179H6E0_PURLI|nr:hypothetical protein VFPFJ_07559 [Purpureocillium lilacinum]OAQ85170.1 hypothetical protein VFPFJ_07559 [Purpureocillium lilacinum]